MSNSLFSKSKIHEDIFRLSMLYEDLQKAQDNMMNKKIRDMSQLEDLSSKLELMEQLSARVYTEINKNREELDSFMIQLYGEYSRCQRH